MERALKSCGIPKQRHSLANTSVLGTPLSGTARPPADLRLVSVHTRRIYVPVAMFESSEYGRKAIIVLIDTKPQEGHRVT